MIFEELELHGAYVIELERHDDSRGYFARTWSRDELAEHGLEAEIEQCSISHNRRAGTTRGMHWQAAPHGETKVVTCISGAVVNVIVDLRDGSPTFRRWVSVELAAATHRSIYVPQGFANGFQTLVDGTELLYAISEPYAPEASRGFRWNDPAFGIQWPAEPSVISERDRSWPDFDGV